MNTLKKLITPLAVAAAILIGGLAHATPTIITSAPPVVGHTVTLSIASGVNGVDCAEKRCDWSVKYKSSGGAWLNAWNLGTGQSVTWTPALSDSYKANEVVFLKVTSPGGTNSFVTYTLYVTVTR
jgi:hypothetical protein